MHSKCNSTQITTGARGANHFWGFASIAMWGIFSKKSTKVLNVITMGICGKRRRVVN